MAVSENYPKLKADGLFQNLQAQLEGTENRIAVARNRYITAVQDYNMLVRSFPQNLTAKMFGYKAKANFTVENEKAISTAPTVDFSKPAAPPPHATDRPSRDAELNARVSSSATRSANRANNALAVLAADWFCAGGYCC